MKKNERITNFVAGLQADQTSSHIEGLDPHYLGYLACFNAGDYYEAHDVLEHLWLQVRGPEHRFYKGLIQFAGAFVHLRKQREWPDHPKHGRRLRPAVRLFQLAEHNLTPFSPSYLHLNVAAVCELSRHLASGIAGSEFSRNPWHPKEAPQLQLNSEP